MEDRSTRREQESRAPPTRRRQRRPLRPGPPRRCSRGQSLALTAIVLLAIATLAFVVTVEIVRRSEYLRVRVIGEVVRITGLPAQAGEVHVAWNGTTTIYDLSLRLPVESEPVLESPAMTIEHRSLLSVILSREVDITAIDIARADVIAAEREHGWTIVEAAHRVAAHIHGRAPGDEEVTPPDLPVITVREARLIVAPAAGERFAVPLEVVGEPGQLRYTVDARLGESRARLVLALGGDWRHGLDVDVAPSRELWETLAEAVGGPGAAAAVPPDALPEAQLSWRGSAPAGHLTGELRIDRARLGDLEMAGTVRAQRIEGGAMADLKQLVLRRGEQRVEVAGGRLRVAGSQFEVQRAQFAAGRGEENAIAGAVEGTVDLDRRSGDLLVRFFGAWPAGRLEHGGVLSAEVRSVGGFPEVRATLEGGGRAGDTEVDMQAALVASGRRWDDMQATLRLDSLSARRGAEVWDIGELRLDGLLLDRRLVLTRFDAARAQRSLASGSLNLNDLGWNLELEADGWTIGPLVESATIGLSARGVASAVESWRAAVETGAISALASGAYNPTDPEPVAASIIIATGGAPPDPEHAGAREADAAAQAAREADDPPAQGLARLLQLDRDASLELELHGTLDPLQLAGVSVLRARPVNFDAPAEELTLAGAAELGGGELRVTSEEFQAFDGACTLRIAATRRDGVVVAIDCDNLSLASLATFAAIEADIEGRAAAQLRARWPRQDRSLMVVDGDWTAQDLRAGPLHADEARGEIEVAEGQMRLRQVLVSRGEGQLRGSIDSDLATWTQVWLDLESEGYEVTVGDVDLAITSTIEGRLDLAQRAGTAVGAASALIGRGGEELGRIDLDGSLDGRLLVVERLEGEIGGGQVTGWASVPLDQWTSGRAALRLDGVEPAALGPELGQAEGRLSGSIAAAPAEDPNAHAPLRIAGNFSVDEGGIRGLAIDAVELEAFVGERRAVLERARAEIAGGSLEVWASTNDHDGDRYIQVSGEAQNMNLDLLVHALAPDAQRYRGRISLAFGGAGYLGTRDRMFGEARVQLRDADLLNLPLIAALHQVMAIGTDGRGEGEAVVRLEGRSLRIPEAGYVNAGTEVRLSLHMADIWAGADSPITGGAMAWLRPLADSPLPFTDTLDRLLAGFQAGGTAVQISGTVGNPRTRETPLKELQSLLGRALGAGG